MLCTEYILDISPETSYEIDNSICTASMSPSLRIVQLRLITIIPKK